MQTFSYMQRSFDDKKNILKTALFLLSIFYEVATSIYPFLPPLLGIAFWIYLSNKEDRLSNLYLFLYTVIFEADHNLAFFSTFLLFFLLKKLFLKIKKIFFYTHILKISAVLSFYLIYPLFLILLNKIFMTDTIIVNLDYFRYILIETILVLVVKI